MAISMKRWGVYHGYFNEKVGVYHGYFNEKVGGLSWLFQ